MIKRIQASRVFCRRQAFSRREGGFTLVEMMVITIIISILVSTAYANFSSAQIKAKTSGVLDNMHAAQIASEAYGTDTGGLYVGTPVGLAPYMPGGGNSATGAAGYFPTNPLSGVSQEVPFQESITDSPTVDATRNSPPTASAGALGQVGYSQCDAPACTSYCVTGTSDTGKRLGTLTSTTILSNH